MAYAVKPKGNAVPFKQELNQTSKTLDKELSEEYILSYLYYENGIIKYNGKSKVYYMEQSPSLTNGKRSEYYGQQQTKASYSFFLTRMDFLRIAEAMMKDYQDQTCVGQYLKAAQVQSKRWYKYRPNEDFAKWWLHNYAKRYGAQFYFDFHRMGGRNIMAASGYNSQNMMIDLDNSRIVVTNSASSAWDQRTYILNVIRDGELPK